MIREKEMSDSFVVYFTRKIWISVLYFTIHILKEKKNYHLFFFSFHFHNFPNKYMGG